MDQRVIKLEFQVLDPPEDNNYTFNSPVNSKIAPPGYYMLFAVKHKSESISGLSKIPSHAKFIKLIL